MRCVKAWRFWPGVSNTPYLKDGLAIKNTFFPHVLLPWYSFSQYFPKRSETNKIFTRHRNNFNYIWCSNVRMSQLVLGLCQGYSVEQHTDFCLFHGVSGVSGITTDRTEFAVGTAVSTFCLVRFREEAATFTCVLTWGQDLHRAALTGVGVYGEIRLALQYAVDKFSAVPVHRIVGICRCHPSNRGTCETEGQSQSVGSSRQSLRDTERMTWDFTIRSKSLLKQPSLGLVCKWNK